MAIALKNNGHMKLGNRKVSKSTNMYRQIAIRLYDFLARRGQSGFNEVVSKMLKKSKRYRSNVSLSNISKYTDSIANKIVVVPTVVTNDTRLTEVPKMKVCAVKVTKTAKERILKNGGEILTFDQLALISPKGTDTFIIRGKTKSREADKHFGKAPGTPHSSTKPYVRSKGRKFEKARGRRVSRGFKV